MAERDVLVADRASPAEPEGRPLRVRLAAFVPITLAILGVGAILLGGVSARHEATAEAPAVDMTATGSIAGD